MKAITITNGDDVFTIAQDQVTNLEGWEYPTVRDVIEDVAGAQSSIYITSKYGRRRLSMTVYIPNQSLSDRRTMLKVLRQNGSMKLLKFTTLDDVLLQAYVEVLSVTHTYSGLAKPFLIEMVAPDWRFYSQTPVTQSIEENTAELVTNNGNDMSYPVYRIHGPITSANIINLLTGEQADITYSLAVGKYMDIDVFNRTITLDDGTSEFSTFDGEFPVLQPGDNVIQFLTVGHGAGTSLDVIYRHAYNGV